MNEPLSYDNWLTIWGQCQESTNTILAKILFAQMYHETGNGSSNLYRTHNNMFGMGVSRSRGPFYNGSVAIPDGPNGEAREVATYETRLLSLQDRLDLDRYNGVEAPEIELDVPLYIQEVVRKGYASDPSYAQVWKRTILNLFPTMMLEGEMGNITDDESPSFFKKSWVKWVLGLLAVFVAWQQGKKYLK